MALLGGSGMAERFNMEAILTDMHGKINLIAQAVETAKDEMRQVRERLHGVSNEVQKLIALNISGTMESIKNEQKEIETRLVVLEHDFHARRGAVGVAKIVYGLGGTTVGAMIVAALKMTGVFQ